VGVHGRNDSDFHENDYRAIREAKIEAIKMMTHTRLDVFKRLKADNPNLEIITRLYDGSTFNERGHPSPEDFCGRMLPLINQLQPYCIKFEIHNEPNHLHRIEGWGDTDDDARDFNQWYLRVYEILKQNCPWAKLGFPGLAIPHRDLEWIELCTPAVQKSDWLGVHCYWQTPRGQEHNHLVEAWGLRFKHYHKLFPDKIIDLTEVGNSNVQSSIPFTEESHAREYAEYLAECFKYPYLNSACWFILSSPDRTWDGFIWRGEDGRSHRIVETIAQLSRPPLIPARGSQPAVSFAVPPLTGTTTIAATSTTTFVPPPAPVIAAPPPPAISTFTTVAPVVTPVGVASGGQNPQLITQLQQLLAQSRELQQELTELQAENMELLGTLQQLQTQPTTSGMGMPIITRTPSSGGIPATHNIAVTVPAPLIQNITGQLPRHATLQYPSRPLNQIDRIIIHHTAIAPTVGAERIASHRVNSQGWPGIGYHYFITGQGEVQQTNELTTIAYHAGDKYNPGAIGIAFAGDFTTATPTPAQIEGGAQLIAWLIQSLNLSPDEVVGYKDLVVTQSPGNQWDAGAMWGTRLRQRIQNYLAGVA
jgi:hypothetical protein